MRSTLIISALLVGVACSTTAQQRFLTPAVREAMQTVSADSVLHFARVLADDDMEGRGTGTRGERRAANWLAAQLHRIGVEPAGDDSTYFQQMPLHGSTPLAESRLEITNGDGRHTLVLGEDYTLYKSGDQTFLPQPQRMVFVGYGIVAPEFDYNDYMNVDVSGTIVVYLSGEPLSDDDDYFGGRRSTLYSIPEMKQRIALSRGARGSIMLPLPRENIGYDWADWMQIFSFEDVRLPITVPGHLSVMLRLEAASLLLDGSDHTLEDLLAMDRSGTVRSFPLAARASFAGAFRERDFLTANVVGVVEGRDPLLRDSYIICSAHYDHLGIGPTIRGDSIYNGFVDNALGCAALLEMARVITSSEIFLRRSVVFLFVSGEEKGMLGSQYYCSNPVVPLYQTMANLNVDGLAIIDTFDDVVGVGSEYSTLQTLLERTAGELGMHVSQVPPEFDLLDAFAGSDQLAFAQAGIPSTLIMEGRSYRNLPSEEGVQRFLNWGRTHYHHPNDDSTQPVNTAAVEQHTRFLLAYLAGLTNTYEPPQWIRGSRYINYRLRTLAEER